MTKALFYVGSCNRALPYFATANGNGIAAFRLDTETGTVEALGVTESIDNPTYLAVAPDGMSLCATSELFGWNEGTITAYGIEPTTGDLTYLDKQPTRGDTTAHLAYDWTGRYVACVNYGLLPVSANPGRSIAIYRRGSDGALGPILSEASHAGTGIDPQRQERPHAHCVSWTPDNRFILVADLGLDQIMLYRFDQSSGGIVLHGSVTLPAGSGPRHFAFHPVLPIVYVANELNATLASFAFDPADCALRPLAVCNTVPSEQFAHCSAIKLAPDGGYLFVANRGHDSVACFSIDPANGLPSARYTVPSGGKTPRDFAFDSSGRFLLVANQDSDCISIFNYDAQDGSLVLSGTQVPVGTPTAISFQPVRL